MDQVLEQAKRVAQAARALAARMAQQPEWDRAQQARRDKALLLALVTGAAAAADSAAELAPERPQLQAVMLAAGELARAAAALREASEDNRAAAIQAMQRAALALLGTAELLA